MYSTQDPSRDLHIPLYPTYEIIVLQFLFLQNIFVRVPILMDHPHTSKSIWHVDKIEVVTVPFESIHLLNDFFNLLYLKL